MYIFIYIYYLLVYFNEQLIYNKVDHVWSFKVTYFNYKIIIVFMLFIRYIFFFYIKINNE